MAISWVCGCGQQLSVSDESAGRSVACPRCGGVIAVPALGLLEPAQTSGTRRQAAEPLSESASPSESGSSPWLFLLTGAALILGLLGLATWRPWASHDPAVTEPAIAAPAVAAPAHPPLADQDRDAPKPPLLAPAPDVKKPADRAPALAARAPTLSIVRIEPEAPQRGGSLRLDVKGQAADGRPVRIEYRVIPKVDWSPAADGKIVLDRLPGEKLILELRAVDDRGLMSPIERRTWSLKPATGKPAPVFAQPLPWPWKLKAGESFFQDLLITQKSTFGVQGLPVHTHLQYRVVSRFTVTEIAADAMTVEQKIESAKLLQADPLTQGLLSGAVARLPGTAYTLGINPKMEVTRFEGGGDVAAMQPILGGLGLQMASLMDRDGWKEMAQVSLFQPERPLGKDAGKEAGKDGGKEAGKAKPWSRPMTHLWGPLGRWTGQTHFAFTGKRGPLDQIAYIHKMTYEPPKAGGGALGLQITSASFQALASRGLIDYDGAQAKAVAAEECFHVRGRLTMMLLGQATPVDIDEEQTFQLKLFDRLP